jgi:hypothetical protein
MQSFGLVGVARGRCDRCRVHPACLIDTGISTCQLTRPYAPLGRGLAGRTDGSGRGLIGVQRHGSV